MHANNHQKKYNVIIFISSQVKFRARTRIRDEERHHLMMTKNA